MTISQPELPKSDSPAPAVASASKSANPPAISPPDSPKIKTADDSLFDLLNPQVPHFSAGTQARLPSKRERQTSLTVILLGVVVLLAVVLAAVLLS